MKYEEIDPQLAIAIKSNKSLVEKVISIAIDIARKTQSRGSINTHKGYLYNEGYKAGAQSVGAQLKRLLKHTIE